MLKLPTESHPISLHTFNNTLLFPEFDFRAVNDTVLCLYTIMATSEDERIAHNTREHDPLSLRRLEFYTSLFASSELHSSLWTPLRRRRLESAYLRLETDSETALRLLNHAKKRPDYDEMRDKRSWASDTVVGMNKQLCCGHNDESPAFLAAAIIIAAETVVAPCLDFWRIKSLANFIAGTCHPPYYNNDIIACFILADGSFRVLDGRNAQCQ
ncbi:hypothetical protein EDD22DRAFT_954688 [Suillus occidentalis]|nr:hypothetical protein EDD22DRAFT_954688 [Suillus occidentalis]